MDHDPVAHPLRTEFLPYSPPTLGEEEIEEVVRTLRSGWITTGPRTAEFERRFADFVGAEDAVGLNSCTAGLQTALALSGIGPGDAVVTTPMTFAGTANVIEHVGAKPVFADVSPDTLNLDPAAAHAAIEGALAHGDRVRAILPVHYGGHPCDMEALDAIAAEHDLVVIEDAAHALPATLSTRRGERLIGGRGGHDGRVLTSFSFYANKNLTTGEGGMLTGPRDVIERARVYRNHGLDRDASRRGGAHASWRYEVRAPGYKFNMTDVAAAMGLRQLEKLPAFHARRSAIAAEYSAAFGACDALQPPTEREGVGHAWHLYTLRLHLERLSIDRDRFIEELDRRNIGTSVHFIPVHLHPWYRDEHGLRRGDFPVAEREFERLISLPVHPGLTAADVEDVIAAVLDVARTHVR
jgi:dTDP-4-amino-4,6-dideoxygalactose transaminase